MKYSHKFREALTFAADVHEAQTRKGTQIPYIGHLLGVASIVIDAGGEENEAIAALLHDAAEDRGGLRVLHLIRERFGDRVAEIVEGCSDKLNETGKEGAASEARKTQYLERLEACTDASVYLVSAADKLHNARATLADFRAIGYKVWDRFNVGRESLLRNYERLVSAYRWGPTDERRKNIVRELATTTAELREQSERFDTDQPFLAIVRYDSEHPVLGRTSGVYLINPLDKPLTNVYETIGGFFSDEDRVIEANDKVNGPFELQPHSSLRFESSDDEEFYEFVCWWTIKYEVDGNKRIAQCNAGKKLRDTMAIDDCPVLNKPALIVGHKTFTR